jgi:hypothetical protein
MHVYKRYSLVQSIILKLIVTFVLFDAPVCSMLYRLTMSMIIRHVSYLKL